MPKFKLDCRNCSNTQKKERGCDQNSIIPNKWELDGWFFSRCPLKLITQQSRRYIHAYNFYKEGHLLPNPGTWQQQPVKFIEVVDLINSVLAEIEKSK